MALDNFDFETTESMRSGYIKRTFAAMAQIAEDDKAKAEDRIAAARVIDQMSDSILKTNLMTEVHRDHHSNNSKLTKQLEKLTDDDKE